MQNEKQIEDMIQNWRIHRLFRAVLVQAAKDAYVMVARSSKQRKIQKEALDFFENKKNLKIVCALADADFEEIWQVINENKYIKKEKYNKIFSKIFDENSFYY